VPTVLRFEGHRVYFYSHEPNEPPHVHVDKAGATMKVWLEEIGVAKSRGFRSRGRAVILDVVARHREAMLEAWHEYFDKSG
jgi:hypothetical protein